MKTLLFFILLTFSSLALASNGLGVGFMIGEPIGVTAKQWLSNDTAVDAAAGWSIGHNPHFTVHSDYLWNKEGALYFQENTPLDLYFGLGARLSFDDEIELGARFPIGLSAYTNERQAEFFGEVAPILNLIPDTNVEGSVLVGLRIYF
jgi:hypothetical protein